MGIIMQKSETQVAMQASMVTIIINLILSVFKAVAGLVAHSGAMISDAIHSVSDVLSTIIVIIGVRVAGKQSDKEHPYGHERLECVASIILAVILMATGLGIGVGGLEKIIAGNYGGLRIPGALALAAAIISIVAKEWMYWYTRAAAKKIGSGALMADAWHHRSDALSSVGAFAGILGARLGFPVMDSVASVVICLFIGKVAVDIFKDAVEKMVDKSCDQELVQRMKAMVEVCPKVERVDDIRTRMFGNKAYVDIEIAVDGKLILEEAHRIAETVHDLVEKQFTMVKHCMVHVNPLSREQKPSEDQNPSENSG